MKRALLILTVCLSLNSCKCKSSSDFENGKRQLEAQGYTEIKNTGHSFFCCGDDDSYATGFKAKNKNGEVVEGCFCSSTFKGVTIRYK